MEDVKGVEYFCFQLYTNPPKEKLKIPTKADKNALGSDRVCDLKVAKLEV